MRIAELKKAMQFAIDEVKKKDTVQCFQNLIAIINGNARTRPNQQQQPITEQKKQLLSAIGSVSLTSLTLNERNILGKFIDLQKLGDSGVALINNIFQEHQLDPMGAVNALTQIQNEFSTLVEAAERTLQVLKPLETDQLDSDIEMGKAAIQITFKSKASVEDIVRLKEWSDVWWEVMRGIALLTKTQLEDCRVLTAQKDSPLIIELSPEIGVVLVLGFLVEWLLAGVERYQNIKKLAAETRQLNLQNTQIAQSFDKEAEESRATIVKSTTAEVMKKFDPENAANGETKNALQISVKNVFNFLLNGGTVDCRVTEKNAAEDTKKLAELFERVRQLESKIETKLLPPPDENNKN